MGQQHLLGGVYGQDSKASQCAVVLALVVVSLPALLDAHLPRLLLHLQDFMLVRPIMFHGLGSLCQVSFRQSSSLLWRICLWTSKLDHGWTRGLSTSLSCFSSFCPFSGRWVNSVSSPFELCWPSLSFQVSATIQQHFPDCSLFCCMIAFACPVAKCFLAAWPDLIVVVECELETKGAITSAFSVANTQMALMLLAARQKDFEMALCAQTAHLSILTHHTNPLSSSWKWQGVPSSRATTSLASTLLSSRSLSTLPHVHCGHCCVSPVMSHVNRVPLHAPTDYIHSIIGVHGLSINPLT